MKQDKPVVKQIIDEIGNNFMNGNISAGEARQKLMKNIGVNRNVADRFVKQWQRNGGDNA